MKKGLRNKIVEKRLERVIFEVLGSMTLLYAHYSIYFILLSEQYEQYLCSVKIQEKVFEPTTTTTTKGFVTFEPHREKTGFLPMRKQRRRSASQ